MLLFESQKDDNAKSNKIITFFRKFRFVIISNNVKPKHFYIPK